MQDADADASAPRCVRAPGCAGGALLDEPFSDLPAGAWNAEGSGAVLDTTVFVSAPSSARATAEEVGGGGRIVTTRPAAGTRMCFETCLLVDYDPAAFGTTPNDFVQLVSLTFRNGDAGEQRTGGFVLGLASLEYVFSDGTSPFTVSQLAPGAFPRGHWAHARIEMDYGAVPAFELFIDGVSKLQGALAANASGFSSLALAVGASANGAHGKVDARFDDVRLTAR